MMCVCVYVQILEAEGMSVPDEVPEILQLVSDFLQQPCPITSSVDTQQGDRKRRASEDGDRGRGDLTRVSGPPLVLHFSLQ